MSRQSSSQPGLGTPSVVTGALCPGVSDVVGSLRWYDVPGVTARRV